MNEKNMNEENEEIEEESPTVIVKRKTKGTVGFYCQYCRTTHTHGSAVLGHRLAHCTNEDSPYKRNGYILKMGDD